MYKRKYDTLKIQNSQINRLGYSSVHHLPFPRYLRLPMPFSFNLFVTNKEICLVRVVFIYVYSAILVVCNIIFDLFFAARYVISKRVDT